MNTRMDDSMMIQIQERYIMSFRFFLIKDLITHYHSLRVSEVAIRFCIFIGENFGFSPGLLQQMYYMHDIGKIGIENRIIKSKRHFNERSKERIYYINKHPQIGYELLKGLPKTAVNIARYHHERWDGKGYPSKITGKRIPLEARIAALIDAFDAIVAKRNYKEEKSLARGLKILKEDSGSHFDPRLVENFDCFIHDDNDEIDDIFINLYPLSLISSKIKLQTSVPKAG